MDPEARVVFNPPLPPLPILIHCLLSKKFHVNTKDSIYHRLELKTPAISFIRAEDKIRLASWECELYTPLHPSPPAWPNKTTCNIPSFFGSSSTAGFVLTLSLAARAGKKLPIT
jgi:hypothetical protein